MTNENEKRVVSALEGMARHLRDLKIVAAMIFFLMLGQCVPSRADSTFVAIEKAKPRVCEKVCQICGHCIPKMIWREGDDIPLWASMSRWWCDSPCDPFINNCIFELYGGCDLIIWGRWRTICRVDTVKHLPKCDTIGDKIRWHSTQYYITFDTIYTDDPRCDSTKAKRP